MKFAAVDIGSNAIRLAIFQVLMKDNRPIYKKISLYRVPVRLGEDAFLRQRISDYNINRLIKTMHAFRNLIDVFEPKSMMVCATSAMREAVNGPALAERIREECDLPIEIIDGKMEARLIFSNHIEQDINPKKSYIYIDVGGGSTELSVFQKGEISAQESFNLGTVRILQGQDHKSEWARMREWLDQYAAGINKLTAIGSGGNINKLYKLAKGSKNYYLTFVQLREIRDEVGSLSYEERITELDLKPDRADVIVPAANIYIDVMSKCQVDRVYIPQFGLVDGMIHQLYEDYVNQN